MKNSRKASFNKWGFTLIELLAVIVILAIILVIAVPNILNVITSSRNEAWSVQTGLIKNATMNYINMQQLDSDKYPIYKDDQGEYIELSNLIDVNMLKQPLTDPRTKKPLPDNLRISILDNRKVIIVDDPKGRPTINVDPTTDEILYGDSYDIYNGVSLYDADGGLLDNKLLTVTCTKDGNGSDCNNIGNELGWYTITYYYGSAMQTRDVNVIIEVLNEPVISVSTTDATYNPLTVTINFQQSRRAKNYYKIDNGDWVSYTAPFTVSNNSIVYAKIEISGQSYNTSQYRIRNIVPTGWLPIVTKADLINVKNLLTGKYIMINDIDIGDAAWTPIVGFAGALDGNDFKIKNLNFNSTGTNMALFGTVTGANVVIKNLTLENVNIKGAQYTAGLVAQNSGAGLSITNVGVTGSIEGTSNYVGSLVGYSTATSTITSCYSTATVKGAGSSVGGLVGSANVASSNMTLSYATGNVTNTGSYTGGLIGSSGGTISKCYATGNVTGAGSTGGLIGSNAATLNACYASGNVTSTANNIGGLVGTNTAATGKITDCYALGDVNGGTASNVGGLVGTTYNNITNAYSIGKVTATGSYVGPILGNLSGATLTNSYWNAETSMIYTSTYGTRIDTAAAGKKSTSYSGFDFTNVWDIIDGETTPYLKGLMIDPKNYITSSSTYTYEGTGTISDPFLVKSAEDLYQMRKLPFATYKLMNDINLTGTAYAEWTPITGFIGTLDGNGHKIKNLSINNSSLTNAALFGTTGSNVTIKNLILENVSIKGGQYTAGLIGQCSGTNVSITNVGVTGSVEGTNHYVGGLISYSNASSTITNSYSTATVKGAVNYVGGLIGMASGTNNIALCYASGNITATGTTNYVGGLIGFINTSDTVTKCYASGNVIASSSGNSIGGLIGQQSGVITDSYALGDVSGGSQYVGGLIGYSVKNVTNTYNIGKVTTTSSTNGPIIGYTTGGTRTNTYWNAETSQIYTGNGTIINTAGDSAIASTYVGFDFTNTWDIIPGETTPYLRGMMIDVKNNISSQGIYAREGKGTSADPYLIKTGQDLYQIRTSLYAYFKLMNDIDLTSTSYSPWTPITGFGGHLDGNGYKIKGLYINNTSLSNAALIGTTSGTNAEIKNLTLENVNIKGKDYTAALIGKSSSTNLTITNVNVSGSVEGTSTYVSGLVAYNDSILNISNISITANVKGTGYIGGLIGHTLKATTVTSSYSTGTITAAGSYAGGLIGYAQGVTTVSLSYTTGNVTNNGGNTGGLIGQISTGGSIIKSYVSGNVTTTGASNIGGLTGWNSGTITDCYVLGSVNGGNGSSVGGLTGRQAANITNAYSIGKVTSTGTSIGPIIGLYSSGTNTSIYWDTTASGISTATYGTGLTTAQMQQQSSFTGFDFTNIWTISAGNYPTLRGM